MIKIYDLNDSNDWEHVATVDPDEGEFVKDESEDGRLKHLFSQEELENPDYLVNKYDSHRMRVVDFSQIQDNEENNED